MYVGLTGANGMLGSAILDRLRSRNHQVRALGRTPISGDFVAVDLQDADAVVAAAAGLDFMVHAAGKTVAAQGDQSNVDMARAVGAAAAAEDIAVVNLSSVAVYGTVAPRVVTESTPPQPASAYGRSKLHAEHAIDLASEKACHLRIGNVWESVRPVPSARQRLIRANEVLHAVLVQDVADLVTHLVECSPQQRPRVLNVVRPGLGDVAYRTLYGPVGPMAIPDRFMPIGLAHRIRKLRGMSSLPNKVFASEVLDDVGFVYADL